MWTGFKRCSSVWSVFCVSDIRKFPYGDELDFSVAQKCWKCYLMCSMFKQSGWLYPLKCDWLTSKRQKLEISLLSCWCHIFWVDILLWNETMWKHQMWIFALWHLELSHSWMCFSANMWSSHNMYPSSWFKSCWLKLKSCPNINKEEVETHSGQPWLPPEQGDSILSC